MNERCRKAAGGKLEQCPSMHNAIHHGLVRLQALRNFETGKRRERLAIVKGKSAAPLFYCPFCRASIDTSPPTRDLDE